MDGPSPPLRAEGVLAAVGTGLWRWDGAGGLVTLDARAAELLGLPPATRSVPAAAARARVHPEDYADAAAAVRLALAEHGTAEARLRLVGEDGRVFRTVRTRVRGVPAAPGSGQAALVGEIFPAPDEAAAAVPAGDTRRAREAFLLDAGRALAEAGSTAEVLQVAASLSMPGFSPEGLAVFAVEGDRIRVIGHHGHHGHERPFLEMPVETDYPAAVVTRTGRAIYLPTPDSYRRSFPASWPLVEPMGRSSWAFLPLVAGGRTMGAWLAAFREPVDFGAGERSVLTTVARMLAQALSRTHLQETERELADGLQQTMRPTHRRDIRGMTLAARYVPTGGGLQVGGDWYDVIDLPSGRTAVVIGDVQGHDVRAAALMGQLRIALRAYAAEGHPPDAVLSRASRFLSGLAEDADDKGRFATCLYMEADPDSGTLEVARAGHCEPAVRLPDGTTIVRHVPGGLPLGVEADCDYPTTRLVLEPGEVLLACTDGLLETGRRDLDSGWQRLVDALSAAPAEDLEAMADTVVRAVRSYQTTGPPADRREDDLALLLLRRGPEPARTCPARRTMLTVAQDDASQVKNARDEVRALLHDWVRQEQVDTAALLVSELLSNVLLHTEGDAALRAEVVGCPGGRRLRIEVADCDDEMPHRRTPGELASTGRGLVLLDRMASAWGVEPRGQGKSIWFELNEDGGR